MAEGRRRYLEASDLYAEDLQRSGIDEMGKSKADSKALLDTAVPHALGRVLDGTPSPGAQVISQPMVGHCQARRWPAKAVRGSGFPA